MEEFADFARLVEAIRPWLGQLVIVGGWAHRLYRFHDRARVPGYAPLRTRDADLAFSLDAPPTGDILSALSGAGFHEHLSGEHVPPVTYYQLGEDVDAGFYVEFLAPLQGSGFTRSGKPDATVSQAGITAQKLRHVHLLLTAPWSIDVARDVGVPIEGTLHLLVPNPVSFIVQKLLIQQDRKAGKRAQDALYLHDTLELFGESLDDLRTLWNDHVRAALPARTAARTVSIARDLFREVTDTIREAARIAPDRQLQPETVRAACEYGLDEILGASN